MKYGLFGVAGLISLATAAGAWALPQSDRHRSYPTVAEARRNPPEVYSECRDANGRNVCTLAMVILDGPEGLLWLPVWAEPDEAVRCVTEAAVDDTVSCDSLGAVLVLVPPKLQVRLPSPRP